MNSRRFRFSDKDCLNRLNRKQKIQYIWDYYKLPIVICLIFIYIIGYALHGHFSKKEILLYTGLVNISVNEQLTTELCSDFIDSIDANASKTDLKLYTGLCLTDNTNDTNHEYVYASRVKILASIDNEKLDIVLMNKEAFDAFSQNGYLYNMEDLLQNMDSQSIDKLKPYLVSNTVILEDNADNMHLNQSLPYQATTEKYPMGLNLSQNGLFKKAGYDDNIYLGVIKNSPRMDMSVEYIKYLYLNK